MPVGLLTSTAWSESRFNQGAIGAVGEVSFVQLHPRGRRGRLYLASCAPGDMREACVRRAAELGALELRDGFKACGTWGMAVGRYKSGRCIEGPRSRAVLHVWAWVDRAVRGL